MIEEDNVSDPFLTKPYIDNYCNEKVPPEYLTREDILELGFLRNDITRTLYKHTVKPNIYLLRVAYPNFGKKDIADERVEVYSHNGTDVVKLLYSSVKPNKEDIQQIINNYAA